MADTIPAVIYAAKSTEDRAGSIPTQLEDCRRLAEREGYVVAEDDEFTDEGFSAYTGNRGPGLEAAKARAVELATAHGQSILLGQHSDRLARGAGDAPNAADHLGELYFRFKRQGVTIHTYQEGVIDDLRAVVSGSRNTEDSRRKSLAVRDGKTRQLERGQRLGGPTPDGYHQRVERDAADKVIARHYEPDPERAPVIQRIGALAAEGFADADIGRTISAEGLRTKAGKVWTRRQVQAVLTNAFYAGRIVKSGEGGKKTWRRLPEPIVVQGTHPPLIEPEVFDRIQALRASRDKSKTGRPKGGRVTTRYALAKLAVCNRCGERMFASTSPYKRKDGTHRRAYVCSHVHTCTGECDAPRLDAEKVDAAIIAHLDNFVLDFDGWLERVTVAQTDEREGLARQIDAARKQVTKLGRAERRARERLTDALADDDALADTYAEAMRDAKQSREQAEVAVADLEATLAELTDDAPADAMLDFWNDLRASVRGVTSAGSTLHEVNARLRTLFTGVRLEQVERGVVAAMPVLRDDVIDRYGDGNLRILGPGTDYTVTDQPAPDRSPAVIFASGEEQVAPPSRTLLFKEEQDSHE